MIVVLGGGPAGRIASIRLATAGKKVTLVESGGKSGGIGGQCLHFGCMPVCALNDVARIISSARRFYERGMTDVVPALRFSKVMDEMYAVQQKIAGILDEETRNAGVDVVYGKSGRVDGPQVFIGDEPVAAEATIIATGSGRTSRISRGSPFPVSTRRIRSGGSASCPEGSPSSAGA